MRPLAPLLCVLIVSPSALSADDGAASIAAGGLIVMKHEPRIVMAKEVLRISPREVVVDYDFRNDSDQDIDTVVAFPVAPYTMSDYYWSHEEAFNQRGEKPSESRIASFKLQVNGKPKAYRTETKAFLNGRDYAPLLRSMKVDPATFGHAPEEDVKSDFDGLTPAQIARLRAQGLLGKDKSPNPKWTVELRYYWTEHFPAHGTVHIRHQYVPISGEIQVPPDLLPGQKLTPEEKETAESIQRTLHQTCIANRDIDLIRKTLTARPQRDMTSMSVADSSREWFSHLLVMDWVDFILTTANTWKQPIEDFTLIVDRKPYKNEPSVPIHFCGDGPLSSGDGTTSVFHATNFIPKQELKIGFFRY